jgi:hypothetical protein
MTPVSPPSDVPWTRPTPSSLGGEDESPGHWYSGRGDQQEKAPKRFASLQHQLATALSLDQDDHRVTLAVAEVALGATIRIGQEQYTKISDSSLAITDAAGETRFLNLDTGEFYPAR